MLYSGPGGTPHLGVLRGGALPWTVPPRPLQGGQCSAGTYPEGDSSQRTHAGVQRQLPCGQGRGLPAPRVSGDASPRGVELPAGLLAAEHKGVLSVLRRSGAGLALLAGGGPGTGTHRACCSPAIQVGMCLAPRAGQWAQGLAVQDQPRLLQIPHGSCGSWTLMSAGPCGICRSGGHLGSPLGHLGLARALGPVPTCGLAAAALVSCPLSSRWGWREARGGVPSLCVPCHCRLLRDCCVPCLQGWRPQELAGPLPPSPTPHWRRQCCQERSCRATAGPLLGKWGGLCARQGPPGCRCAGS